MGYRDCRFPTVSIMGVPNVGYRLSVVDHPIISKL